MREYLTIHLIANAETKMRNYPVKRVMYINCGERGCIWVMSDGTAINMTKPSF